MIEQLISDHIINQKQCPSFSEVVPEMGDIVIEAMHSIIGANPWLTMICVIMPRLEPKMTM